MQHSKTLEIRILDRLPCTPEDFFLNPKASEKLAFNYEE